ncbi:putative site-specific recombinase [Nocardia brasiliensis NBRC 14402]|uniref:site-specific integrase n=1 Tax=Nocardia brasiliensis TaxID=37326 RepID=UPI0002E51AB4|nr:site-specific integrase [Nocardia brasiliensis]ASF07547.1 integrase [Nocardia brasiliensis]GAJ81876.1 putative site-specific recombinase [Nocardia brasiliensis NBRC 14402]SUB55498.1 site-specific tyrosine recombinase XerD [Nocardia brasiliensis]
MEERSAVVAVPESVRNELRRGVRSVLVDAAALRLVRERFDEVQAGSLRRYLEASQSANTLRAYRTDWIAWSAWCVAESRQAMPADPLDVAVYLAAAADARRDTGGWAFSAATLERKSAAIAAVHAANGLPSPTRSDVVRLTLRGIRRTRRTQPTRKRPVLLHTLDQLLAGLPEPGWPNEPARRRDALMLLVGFAGALRRSELAGLRIADVEVRVDHATGEPVLLVRLPSTKTDPTGVAEQRVALPRGQRPHTCPVCAFADWVRLLEILAAEGTSGLRAWLADGGDTDPAIHRCHGFTGTALAADPDLPLCPTINRHGTVGTDPMSGRAVAELVKRYAARAGLDPDLFSGHSLRAGFATQAALGGASDREIMRQGRWSNPRTVHGYIRTANPLEDNAVTKLGL